MLLFTLLVTADLPNIITLSPTIKWPLTPACPPIWQFSPIFEDPAIPHWAAITVFLPITTLWAIWIWLSSLTPSCIIVDPKVALSIEVNAPTLTLFFIITLPIWGILI